VIPCGRIAAVLTIILFTLLLIGKEPSRGWATPAYLPLPVPLFIESPRAESAKPEAPAKDMFGNEVTSAVATYKLDASGSLYEEHSPDTELPRLGSPTS
jgi:hypothetical protein